MIVNQRDIQQLIERDKIFSVIYDQYGPPPNWSREPGFVSLSRIILEQQVSLASANAHFQKLSHYIGTFLPQNILNLTDDEMRACHVSRQKATYLRILSQAIIREEINLTTLHMLDEEDARTQLTRLKGIGRWTSDIYLMFCMQAKDILPVGDIAVVSSIKELYGVQSVQEIKQLSEQWRPLRSLASYFFWHYYLRKRNRPSV